MNQKLFALFNRFYNLHPTGGANCGPGSTLENTQTIRETIPNLVKEFQIESIFDGGCGDLNWMKEVKLDCKYSCGDISDYFVELVKNTLPEIDIKLFDITTDSIAKVDLVMFRDVLIHLNTKDKYKALTNFVQSGSKYLLVTHNPNLNENTDFEYAEVDFPEAQVNWFLSPWNFSEPVKSVVEKNTGIHMCLWTNEDIKKALAI